MVSIALGPLAIPVTPLVLLLAFGLASWLARWLAGPAKAEAASQLVLVSTLAGFLAARLGYLGLHADLYIADPWAALDLRDGGWWAPFGVATGLGWLTLRGYDSPALRVPLAAAALAGIAVWQAAGYVVDESQAQQLPALAMVDLASGAPLSLDEAARRRPVVVNLWASWCGPCRAEMPTLAAAQQRDSTVGFLFVNQGEPAERVRAYLAREALPLSEVLLDRDGALGAAIGSSGLPTTLFYDARGRLVESHFGVLNAAALEARLRQLRRPG